MRVRYVLIKNYKIKVGIADAEGQVTFTTLTEGDKAIAIQEFTNKINELMDAEGEDISLNVHLPDNISIEPGVLKPLLAFLIC